MNEQERENKRIIREVTFPGTTQKIQITPESIDAAIEKVKQTYLLACRCGEMVNSETNLERQKDIPCTREGCEGKFIWSYAQTAKVPLRAAS